MDWPESVSPGLAALAEAARERAGITRVTDVTGLDRIGIPVVIAVRPLGRSLAVSQGKGPTHSQARLGALLEALELFHAERHALPLRYGRRSELPVRPIAVERLPLLAGASTDPDRAMLWVDGYCLTGGERLCVPYDCVHCDFTVPGPPSYGFVQTSNGLGAGESPSAAARHALLEVIERDSLALFAADPESLGTRLLDVSSHSEESTDALLQHLERAGLSVVAYDVTSDIGVATVCCRIVEREVGHGGMAHVPQGSAADPLPERAFRRALLEAVQTRLTFISGGRDDISPTQYRAAERNRERAFWLSCSQLHEPRRMLSELPTGPSGSNDETIAWICGNLSHAGIEQPVIVDLSDPEIGVCIVRVVVPGLEAPPHPAHRPGARIRGRSP
jgi:YcaO-like protein with predicted kinase domain